MSGNESFGKNTRVVLSGSAGRPTITNIEPGVEEVSLTLSNISDMLDIDENLPINSFAGDLNISILNKGGHWYDNLKIDGKSNSKYRIKNIDMNNKEIFKLSGIISVYIEYTEYYNRIAEVISHLPNVDQINTIHSEEVLVTIDKLQIDVEDLKNKILNLKKYVQDFVRYKIQTKKIVVEEITFKYYLNTILNVFRIGRRIPLDYKSKIERL